MPPGIVQMRAQHRDFRQRPGAAARVEAGKQGFEACDLAALQDLGRNESCALEDAVRDSRLGGHERILVERERLAGARQIVEFAASDRLEYAAFSDGVESEQGNPCCRRWRLV